MGPQDFNVNRVPVLHGVRRGYSALQVASYRAREIPAGGSLAHIIFWYYKMVDFGKAKHLPYFDIGLAVRFVWNLLPVLGAKQQKMKGTKRLVRSFCFGTMVGGERVWQLLGHCQTATRSRCGRVSKGAS